MNENDWAQLRSLRKPCIAASGGFAVFYMFLIAVSIAGGFPTVRGGVKLLVNDGGVVECALATWIGLTGFKWCALLAIPYVGVLMGYMGHRMRIYDESVPESRRFMGVSKLTTTLIFVVGFPLWIITVALLWCAWFNPLSHQAG